VRWGAMCRQGVVVSRLSAVAETSPAFLCTFDLLELNGTAAIACRVRVTEWLTDFIAAWP
jgi:hypothetical protein